MGALLRDFAQVRWSPLLVPGHYFGTEAEVMPAAGVYERWTCSCGATGDWRPDGTGQNRRMWKEHARKVRR